MISQIRSYPLLLGVRGEKRKDIETVADTIIKVGTDVAKMYRYITILKLIPW